MERDTIVQKLQEIFARVFQEPGIQIHDGLTAEQVSRWDSLSHLTMISDVEQSFGIKFKLKELIGMKNVGELIQLISQKTT
ncbi:MAG: acyl carrier protein [Bacteroidetes bacterium]|nr:acyl carrier protein [Bacteroidota bacterium]